MCMETSDNRPVPLPLCVEGWRSQPKMKPNRRLWCVYDNQGWRVSRDFASKKSANTAKKQIELWLAYKALRDD